MIPFLILAAVAAVCGAVCVLSLILTQEKKDNRHSEAGLIQPNDNF